MFARDNDKFENICCRSILICLFKRIIVNIIVNVANDNLYSAVCTRITSRALHNKHEQLSTEHDEYTEMRMSINSNINNMYKTHVTEGHHYSLSNMTV